MAGHRCIDVDCHVASPPLIIECRLTCEVSMNWEDLRDSEGRELRDVNGEKLRVKRSK